MTTGYLSPTWFYGYDVVLEFIFAIIAFTIAGFAWRIYRISSQDSAKYLSLSFLLISLSYIAQSVFNLLFISKLNENISVTSKISWAIILDQLGFYFHMILFILGLAVLLFMTFKTTKERSFLILIALTLVALLVYESIFFKYYLLASIYLGFIAWYFIENFIASKNPKAFLISLAFTLLFFGYFNFFLAINNEMFYAVGHFLELAAYVLILVNFYLVLKK
jgi:hypothetical protein